jgi:sorting nexin-13
MEATGGAQRPHTLRDLAEEGKKRAVLLLVFVFGLAFLMSRESPVP